MFDFSPPKRYCFGQHFAPKAFARRDARWGGFASEAPAVAFKESPFSWFTLGLYLQHCQSGSTSFVTAVKGGENLRSLLKDGYHLKVVF